MRAALTCVAAFLRPACASGLRSEGRGVIGQSCQASRAPIHSEYRRDAFAGGRDDVDQNCLIARAEVLVGTSSTGPTISARGDSTIAGLRRDAYAGATYRDVRTLDIDHMEPPAES